MPNPIVVQHSVGAAGTGGPQTALLRVLNSELASRYSFVPLTQQGATGSIDTRRIREWAAWLNDLKPDMVHVRGLGSEGFHAAAAARIAGCRKILVTVHGTHRDLTVGRGSPKRWVMTGALEPATLSMASHVATVSQAASRRRFLSKHRHKLIAPIENGVPLPALNAAEARAMRADLGLSESKTVLVSVGRLSFEKGHRSLALALQNLPLNLRSQIELLIIGAGPDAKEIIQGYQQIAGLATKPLGLRTDVLEILQCADVFVFPSLHENLSNALLEAMASGLPVVATAVGGNVEIVEQGGGVLVPPLDVVALSGAIADMVQSPGLRLRLGGQARTTVEGRYTITHMLRRLDAAYETILNDGAPR